MVWKAFWGTVWHTTLYPLPLMTLTEEQGEWLTKELYSKLFPEMGVNRNFPRVYRHASKMFLGMRLPDINVECTFVMVSYCMMHGTSDKLTG